MLVSTVHLSNEIRPDDTRNGRTLHYTTQSSVTVGRYLGHPSTAGLRPNPGQSTSHLHSLFL